MFSISKFLVSVAIILTCFSFRHGSNHIPAPNMIWSYTDVVGSTSSIDCPAPIDLEAGTIIATISKQSVKNNRVKISGKSWESIGIDERDDVQIKMVFGVPPEWWCEKYNKTHGSYIQIIVGGQSAIKQWSGMEFTGLDFFEKVGVGESTHIRKVNVLNHVTRWE